MTLSKVIEVGLESANNLSAFDHQLVQYSLLVNAVYGHKFVPFVLTILDARQNYKPSSRVVNSKIKNLSSCIFIFVNMMSFEAAKL